jgi:hypothetical protein
MYEASTYGLAHGGDRAFATTSAHILAYDALLKLLAHAQRNHST